MYGAAKIGYGTEVVQSFNALIDAIKRRQVLRPRSLFAMCLAGVDFAVKLLDCFAIGKTQQLVPYRLVFAVLWRELLHALGAV